MSKPSKPVMIDPYFKCPECGAYPLDAPQVHQLVTPELAEHYRRNCLFWRACQNTHSGPQDCGPCEKYEVA